MTASLPVSPAGDIAAALATRYRPRSFSTLTGQKHVGAILRRAIADRTVPQQLLFSGGSGLGKTTVARILSAALLCRTALSERDNADACGTCSSCLDVLTPGRNHPDLIEFDAASNGGKDEIRAIAQRAQLAPLVGPVKIYIIDEAHGLSGPGGQAFLKLLEEPPAHVVFMLCTTDPHKMLKTNRGRCVEFELLSPPRLELIANLQRICSAEGWVANDEILDQIIDTTDPDLGVRGTIMALAKLSGPLSVGTAIDDELLADLLGSASRRGVLAVFTALDAADPLAALDALEQLRSRSAESTVRAALVAAARSRWIRQLREQSSGEVAADRYARLVNAPEGAPWTDLTVAQLARPALQPGGVPPEVIVAQAVQVADQLSRAVADARSVGAKLVEWTRSARTSTTGGGGGGRAKVPPTTPPPASPSRITGPGAAKASRSRQEEQDAPVTSPPASALTPAPVHRLSGAASQLVAAATPAPAALAGLLAQCTVELAADTLTIVVPPELASALEPMRAKLDKAAGRLGVQLVIV